MKRIILAFSICLLAMGSSAKVRLPQFFSDNMVLQQQSKCRIWGWAEPGKKVQVITSWDKKGYSATTRKDGYFQVTVQTPEAGGPYTITFRDGDTILLQNVLIGEVWICSGQSNMEMQMKGFKQQPVEGTTEELLRCRDSQLRLFTVKRHASLTPVDDVTGQWSEANSASVRDFSATAYYFGRALRQTLGIPVGLIVTSWGGSACEAWMQADWLKAFPKVNQHVTEDDVKKLQQRCPTALYNGQLYPLIGYGMKGAIWYQGEDNIPRYDYYAPLMARMVEGWRADWKQGDFPFYYCQIAPYDYSLIGWKDSQLLREQQLKAEAMIPNSRMAVLMDAGLEYGIHPRKKRQAGERLALLALSNTYAIKGLPDFATYKEVTLQNDTAVIAFDRSKEWVYFEHGTTSKNFEVAGSDQVFHPATKVWVSRNRVYVTCDEVKAPAAVRYAWRDWVEGDLMHDGLPVSSFRTDDWDAAPINTQSKGDYNNPQ
ncbi:MAG: sialate O-acetylesterase [Prevotella sp.]|nr:sialate O-acetylesterase [Prevotella sp.]